MARLGVAIACAVLLAGCSSSDTQPAATTTETTTTASTTTRAIGDTIEFRRTGNSEVLGDITILEVVELPARCLYDPPAGTVLAVRSQVANRGEVFLPAPDVYGLSAIDRGGFTQKVASVSVRSDCGAQFPAIAPSQPFGKTTGWKFVQVREPVALVYTPTVGEPDSTIDNLKLIAVEPKSVTIGLPSPLPSPDTAPPAPPAASPPAAPLAAAPVAGAPCDTAVNTWAKDATGGQLRCAFAGGPTAKWVESVPFIGTRTPGAPCDLGAAVAETADGQTLVCVGDQGSATWMPGP